MSTARKETSVIAARTKYEYSDFLGVLDYLQDQGDVFVSGIDGRSADLNSYMTIVDPKSLRRAIESSNIHTDLWSAVVKFIQTTPNWSPTVLTTAALVNNILSCHRDEG